MTILYFILVHKNPNQVKLLINQLKSDNVIFLLHVDLKSNQSNFEECIYGEDIYYVQNRINVNWGGFSMVNACLEGMRFAIKHIKFDRFIYLTGQDFPIKSNKYINSYFKEHQRKDIVSCFKIPDKQWVDMGIPRITNYSFIDLKPVIFSKILNRVFTLLKIKKSFNNSLGWYGGSAYFALTSETILKIISDVSFHHKLVKYLKYSYCPDEVYFNTFINQLNKHNLLNESLHLIVWPEQGRHPITFENKHMEQLLTSQKLFARKFDIELDSTIINSIIKSINYE